MEHDDRYLLIEASGELRYCYLVAGEVPALPPAMVYSAPGLGEIACTYRGFGVDVDGVSSGQVVYVRAKALADPRMLQRAVDSLVLKRLVHTAASEGDGSAVTLRKLGLEEGCKTFPTVGPGMFPAPEPMPDPTVRTRRWLADNIGPAVICPRARVTDAATGFAPITLAGTGIQPMAKLAHRIVRLYESIGVRLKPDEIVMTWSPVVSLVALTLTRDDSTLPAGLGVAS